jgi:hypothetical protein
MGRRVVLGVPVLAVLALAGTWLPHAVAQPVPAPLPSATDTPSPGATPSAALSPAPVEASPSPAPSPTPTQPPIIVEPPGSAVAPGASQILRVGQVLGDITITVADPTIADVSVDSVARTITITGRTVGRTTATVSDARGLTRDIAIRVAYPAGSIADAAQIRITGHPASSLFVKEQAALAAIKRAVPRPGATIIATPESLTFSTPLGIDDIAALDVPVIMQGSDYLTVQGTTHVRVENVALPATRPGFLMVSDYPETLRENGVLFTADLNAQQAERFLYYHYNPPGQPDRRILLEVENPSSQPALLQVIAGRGGPGPYEMEVGHLSTQRFLVRYAQNEGSVITIAGGATVTLVNQSLPASSVVSNLLQLHEISGGSLHLTLFAQNAGDPVEGPVPLTTLLHGDAPHARGMYKPPEFYLGPYTYDADGENLEVSIGQLPLPNLVEGQALSGDYGVLQSVTVQMVNHSAQTRNVALYANPRGGRATGTFLIDGVLVQAHALPAFSHHKLRQYTLPPHAYVRTEIVTMPEGGSSYPLRLIVGPDDGSPPPGAPDSLVY